MQNIFTICLFSPLFECIKSIQVSSRDCDTPNAMTGRHIYTSLFSSYLVIDPQISCIFPVLNNEIDLQLPTLLRFCPKNVLFILL